MDNIATFVPLSLIKYIINQSEIYLSIFDNIISFLFLNYR